MCSPNQPRRALKRASTSGSCSHVVQCLQSRSLQMQPLQTYKGHTHVRAERQVLLAFIYSAIDCVGSINSTCLAGGQTTLHSIM